MRAITQSRRRNESVPTVTRRRVYAFATHIISEIGSILLMRGEDGVDCYLVRAFMFFSMDKASIDCLVDTLVASL